MTPRKWFMRNGVAPDVADFIHLGSDICEQEGCLPVYVFTEEELKERDRKVFSSGYHCQLLECADTDEHFESYWQRKFGGK